MADYYTQFSEEIAFHNDAQRLWLLAKLEQLDEGEDGSPCSYEEHSESHVIWVYTEESGDPERLAELVADYQQQFKLSDPWILNWAQTCSRPRLSSFSGGTIAVFHGKIKGFYPNATAEQWIKRQQKRIKHPTSNTAKR